MPSHHLFLDFEALAQSPDAAPIELGAVLFDLSTGKILAEFHRVILPHPLLRQDADTLKWHAERGSFPFTPDREDEAATLWSALFDFRKWALAYPFESVWSWGSTYDFPILATASDIEALRMPWHYAQQECARTVWRRVFGDRRHAPRPHHALEDCRAGVHDLCEALAVQTRIESALRSAIARMETIQETHPDIALDRDLGFYRAALAGKEPALG